MTPSSPHSESDLLATRYPLPATSPLDSFLAELLADQQRLITPAARASAVFDAQPAHLRGEAFRDLIPLTAPGPGEQYAFEVDLDSCSGCKACVVACHSLNGLDETESFRDVGLVLGTDSCGAPFQQTVTSACHHCEDPGCLNGCPVLAYEKDPVTGIVVHLDDQCIGCSYCVLKCPYDVPKYNERLGIVRKCDMCHGRLAEGEAPACAQACPTHAIKIIKVPVVSEATTPLLASASVPSPAITTPTTRYISKKPLPTVLRAADARALRPQHAHYALVFLLTFTQISLGLLIGSQLSALNSQLLTILSLAFFAAGLGASVAHLGQPLRAWRVFLGLRKSWLSREAVVLGAAFPLVALTAAQPWIPNLLNSLPFAPPAFITGLLASRLVPLASIAVTAMGVFCSAMIYIDTHRSFWRPSQSFGRMAGTVLIAALAPHTPSLAAFALLAKLALELSTLRGDSASARLQRGPLAPLVIARVFIAGITLPAIFHLPSLIFLILFALGELLERTLFFRAVDSPKMPGVPTS
ncbi:MAG: DmsC/YnfH family molybdoenzyme membrane anchor subunit [Opitutaceae bacterium]|jgi:Fe-S-cluster-containing dehydrogenase component/DMSO reductase anchor subunit